MPQATDHHFDNCEVTAPILPDRDNPMSESRLMADIAYNYPHVLNVRHLYV